MSRKLRALSVIGGCGSMLVGARQQGYDVLGGYEWRKYYYNQDDPLESTFEKNFGVRQYKNTDEFFKNVDTKNIDLVIGHTECGNSSTLRAVYKDKKDAETFEQKVGDTPDFLNSVARIKPNFFALDNLPKLLETMTGNYWNEALPGYDIHFEFVSNYHYGNSQLYRKRLFVIGAKKKFKYVFVPGEYEHYRTLLDDIEDLPIGKDVREMNHLHWPDDHEVRGWRDYQFDPSDAKIANPQNLKLKDFKKLIKKYKPRRNFYYYNKKKEHKKRPSFQIVEHDYPSPVMSGGGGRGFDIFYREDNFQPLTMRERARIQGAPDDFVFYPLDFLNEKNYHVIMKCTGKWMPVQFTTFLTQQIKDHIEGNEYQNVTHERYAKENKFVSPVKEWYCDNVGYSNQKKACEMCGVYTCDKNKHETKLVPYRWKDRGVKQNENI